MSEESILTGLRLTKWLDDRARLVAQRTGVPRNTLIKIVLAGALAREAQGPLAAEQLAAAEAVVAALRPRTEEDT